MIFDGTENQFFHRHRDQRSFLRIVKKYKIPERLPNLITMGMIFREKISNSFSSAPVEHQRSYLRFVKKYKNSKKVTKPDHNGHDSS